MSSIDNVEQLLLAFRRDETAKDLNRYFQEKSFLEILHVDRKENYHSHFLKWVFEDPETFSIANEGLLNILILRNSKQTVTHFPDDIKKKLLVGSFSIDNAKVTLEDPVTNGRSDIVIDISYNTTDHLYIIIENKVYSSEHNAGKTTVSQTKNYYLHYTGKYGKEKTLFVYLTPLSSFILDTLTEPECDSKEFIQINYQDILEEILRPLTSNLSVSGRKRFIVEEYIKGLSVNYSQNCTIMAIDREKKELLINFWDNNHELIELAIAALKENTSLSDDDRQQFIAIQESINQTSNHDNSKYSINNEGEYGKGPLVYEIVKRYIEKEEPANIRELQKKFPLSLRGKRDVLGNYVVISESKYKTEALPFDSKKDRWKKIDLMLKDEDDKESCVYVSTEWGIGNIKKFLEKAEKLGFIIKQIS